MATTGALHNPSTLTPPRTGQTADIQNIKLTAAFGGPAGIDEVQGEFPGTPYTAKPHIGSSRFAEEGKILELTVTNKTRADHPFHLHGFSFQQISLTRKSVV